MSKEEIFLEESDLLQDIYTNKDLSKSEANDDDTGSVEDLIHLASEAHIESLFQAAIEGSGSREGLAEDMQQESPETSFTEADAQALKKITLANKRKCSTKEKKSKKSTNSLKQNNSIDTGKEGSEDDDDNMDLGDFGIEEHPDQNQELHHNRPLNPMMPQSYLANFVSYTGDLQLQLQPVSRNKAPFVAYWLVQQYEPSEGVSLPRSLMYAHYFEHCRMHGMDPVNAATFGKIIRAVFPEIKTRRLGTRGNSKYHYYGIKCREQTAVSSQPMELQEAALYYQQGNYNGNFYDPYANPNYTQMGVPGGYEVSDVPMNAIQVPQIQTQSQVKPVWNVLMCDSELIEFADRVNAQLALDQLSIQYEFDKVAAAGSVTVMKRAYEKALFHLLRQFHVERTTLGKQMDADRLLQIEKLLIQYGEHHIAILERLLRMDVLKLEELVFQFDKSILNSLLDEHSNDLVLASQVYLLNQFFTGTIKGFFFRDLVPSESKCQAMMAIESSGMVSSESNFESSTFDAKNENVLNIDCMQESMKFDMDVRSSEEKVNISSIPAYHLWIQCKIESFTSFLKILSGETPHDIYSKKIQYQDAGTVYYYEGLWKNKLIPLFLRKCNLISLGLNLSLLLKDDSQRKLLDSDWRDKVQWTRIHQQCEGFLLDRHRNPFVPNYLQNKTISLYGQNNSSGLSFGGGSRPTSPNAAMLMVEGGLTFRDKLLRIEREQGMEKERRLYEKQWLLLEEINDHFSVLFSNGASTTQGLRLLVQWMRDVTNRYLFDWSARKLSTYLNKTPPHTHSTEKARNLYAHYNAFLTVFEQSSRTFLLQWSFLSSLIMTDLSLVEQSVIPSNKELSNQMDIVTNIPPLDPSFANPNIRSSDDHIINNFPSGNRNAAVSSSFHLFHIVRVFVEETVLFLVDSRLEEMKRPSVEWYKSMHRRPIFSDNCPTNPNINNVDNSADCTTANGSFLTIPTNSNFLNVPTQNISNTFYREKESATSLNGGSAIHPYLTLLHNGEILYQGISTEEEKNAQQLAQQGRFAVEDAFAGTAGAGVHDNYHFESNINNANIHNNTIATPQNFQPFSNPNHNNISDSYATLHHQHQSPQWIADHLRKKLKSESSLATILGSS